MRPNLESLAVLTPAVYLVCVTLACGEIIYSQNMPDPPGSAFGSINHVEAPWLADNFSFVGDETKTVRSVRVIGSPLIGKHDDQVLFTNNFRIVFFDDANGLPGNSLAGGDFSVSDSVLQKFTGGRLLNGWDFPMEYSIDLGEGIELTPDTVYWVSIKNSPNGNRGWAWARASGLLDQQIATTRDSPSWVISSSGGGMWFELSSRNVVPEPPSLPLHIFGLLWIWCRTRR